MVSVQTFSPAFLTPANVLELMDFYLFVHADACISSYTKNSSHKVYNKSLHTQRIAEYKNHNHTTTWGEHGETVGRREAGGKRLTLFRLVCVVCCLVFLLWVTDRISKKKQNRFLPVSMSLWTHTHAIMHTQTYKSMYTGIQLYVVFANTTQAQRTVSC